MDNNLAWRALPVLMAMGLALGGCVSVGQMALSLGTTVAGKMLPDDYLPKIALPRPPWIEKQLSLAFRHCRQAILDAPTEQKRRSALSWCDQGSMLERERIVLLLLSSAMALENQDSGSFVKATERLGGVRLMVRKEGNLREVGVAIRGISHGQMVFPKIINSPSDE